jgi:hypothetical protein
MLAMPVRTEKGMHLTLALLLSAVPAQQAAPAPTLDNLAFGSGRLTHWEGEGFYVRPADGSGPSLRQGVCSSDRGGPGRTALLHRAFVVPGAGVIRFSAAAVRRKGCEPGPDLDVLLQTADGSFIPKEVRGDGWRPVSRLLPPADGRPREYLWRVEHLAGRWARILLLDRDDRRGCHVVCSGFRIAPRGDFEAREFDRDMRRLAREHHLASMSRAESRHFLAIGNADEAMIERRLHDCELIHALFFDHFRRRGLAVREPPGKLLVAVLDSQAGFEACVGQRLPDAVTGLYHRGTNRLVIYDVGRNRAFQEARERGRQQAQQLPLELDRRRAGDAVSRQARDWRDDVNLTTVMHEAAHQLSFNSGLLNRGGDVPVWLAEGLACYCEPSEGGSWQGPGEPNPRRAAVLAGPLRGQGALVPLRTMIEGDDWLRRSPDVGHVLVGYAQSWALFRFLLRERPEALRRYLALIQPRRTPDSRLTAFGTAFGADLERLEARYREYLAEVTPQPRPGR